MKRFLIIPVVLLLFSGSAVLLAESEASAIDLAPEAIGAVSETSTAGAYFPLDWFAESDQVGAEFGYAVSTAGDVNGDNYDDVIVGAPRQEIDIYREGAVFVYHGSPGGVSDFPDWVVGSQLTGARLGNSVGPAGDVNGDGYDDVIVGAYRYNNEQPEEGAVFVFYGARTGLGQTADWMIESDQKEAQLGFSVGTAGDVNNDGYADVIVGARYYSNGESYEGAAFVYLGSSTGLATVPSWSFEGGQANAGLGSAVATAGDVNGDSFSDVVIGAPGYDGDESEAGIVYVFYGSASGLSATPDWIAQGDQPGAEFGTSVHTAGDVNFDGYDDLLVGAPWYDSGDGEEGAAFLFRGSAGGLNASAHWMATGDRVGDRFGHSVRAAGDVNQDNFGDVIIGAPGYDNGQPEEGCARVFLGSTAGLSQNAVWQTEGEKAEAGVGFSVGSAGDVNSDGFVDLIVGAPDYRHYQDIVGRAFVYRGTEVWFSFFIFVPMATGGAG